MVKHTFILIFRNFKRFKSTFLINLIGLSTGMCCAILIYLWLQDEWLMDKFHDHDRQLYQVMVNQNNEDRIITGSVTPGILADALAAELPEISLAASSYATELEGKITVSAHDKSMQVDGLYASRDFLKVFSYPLIAGDPATALSSNTSVIISRAIAESLFGDAGSAVGKTIEWNHEKEYLVTGVLYDIPSHSSAHFDFLLSYDVMLDRYPHLKEWGSSDPSTYVVLKDGTDLERFNLKISGFMKSKVNGSDALLFVRRYSSAYLYNHFENGIQAGGRIQYVHLFSIIGVFIIAIACINFMNLSTAKASRRIKEVGVKKAIGARRRVLIFQYLGESVLLSLVALILAVLMADLSLSSFNAITGKNLELSYNFDLMAVCFGIAVFTGVMAGSYPAFYLSGFKPAAVLKGKLNTAVGESWARNGLVVFQFVVTVVFIICVIVVNEQISYVQSRNLGYNKDNIFSFQMAGSIENILTNREPLLNEARKLPGVLHASSMDHASIIADYGTLELEWEGMNPGTKLLAQNIGVNYGLVELMGMEIKEGRTFSRELSSDSAEVILNETAVDVMGLKEPLGKLIDVFGIRRKIVGIVKDFHVESLHENVKPFLMRLEPQLTHCVVIKVKAGREQETLGLVQDIFKRFSPGFVFNYRFFDQDFQAQYAAETRISVLSKYFAGLAIIISCLGLFGLASFTADRRNKEIGIRKILGSSEWNIVFLLSRDFTKIVLTAVAIALPLGYILTRSWLDSFAFKIDLSIAYFAGAGIVALLIAWATIGGQAILAARINPVKTLKNE